MKDVYPEMQYIEMSQLDETFMDKRYQIIHKIKKLHLTSSKQTISVDKPFLFILLKGSVFIQVSNLCEMFNFSYHLND